MNTSVRRKRMIEKATHAHLACMNTKVRRKSMIEKAIHVHEQFRKSIMLAFKHYTRGIHECMNTKVRRKSMIEKAIHAHLVCMNSLEKA